MNSPRRTVPFQRLDPFAPESFPGCRQPDPLADAFVRSLYDTGTPGPAGLTLADVALHLLAGAVFLPLAFALLVFALGFAS
jgi:hypothetical protein